MFPVERRVNRAMRNVIDHLGNEPRTNVKVVLVSWRPNHPLLRAPLLSRQPTRVRIEGTEHLVLPITEEEFRKDLKHMVQSGVVEEEILPELFSRAGIHRKLTLKENWKDLLREK